MPETFNVGDEVTLISNRRGTVEFGPFTGATSRRSDTYLVKLLEGTDAGSSVTALSTNMKRGPKFKAGDAVTAAPLDMPATVVAGPFTARMGSTRYVVKYESSDTHGWAPESSLTKADPHHLIYRRDGIAWDLTATYTDRDNDRWVFNGEWYGGEPLMDSPTAGRVYQNRSLSSVLGSFGPLTKVDD